MIDHYRFNVSWISRKKQCFQMSDLFETLELKIPGPWPLELSKSVVSWQNPFQIHHCHGLFLNVTGHSSRSPASFAMAPVPDNLSALPPYGSGNLRFLREKKNTSGLIGLIEVSENGESPVITMGFNMLQCKKRSNDLGWFGVARF